MPEGGEYKIRLTTEADLKDAKSLQNEIDATKIKVSGLADEFKKAGTAAKEALNVPYSGDPNSHLASGVGAKAQALRNAEREAGLRTERTMAAEAREAEIQAMRVRSVMGSGALPGGSPIGASVPQLSAMSGAVQSLASSLGGMVAKYFAWYEAIKMVKNGLTESIGGFAEQEQAINRLNQALIQNGTYSVGYSAHLQNLAEQFRQLTGIGQGEWIEVFRKLSQFGADSSNIDQYANAVKNLAGIYGSVEQATMAMQKALEGNFETFRRHGIYVDQTATQTEKLKSLFSQLATVGGGQLEEQLNGLSGAWKSLSSESHQFGVNLGRTINDALGLESAVRGLAYVMGGLAETTNKVSREETDGRKAHDHYTRSLHDQHAAANRLNEEFRAMREHHEDITRAIHSQLSVQTALNEAQQSQNERARAAALSNLRAREERGLVTPQQGLIQRASIEQAFDTRATALREQHQRDEIAAKDAEIQASQAAERDYQDKINKANDDKRKRQQIAEREQLFKNAQAQQEKIERDIETKEDQLRQPGVGVDFAFGTDSDQSDLREEIKNLKKLLPGATRLTGKLEARRLAEGEATGTDADDQKEVERLTKDLKEQKEKTHRAQQDAAVARQNGIGRIQTEELNRQNREGIRSTDLGTDMFRANGGLPSVHLSPAEVIAQSRAFRQQLQVDFAKAIREHDTQWAQFIIEMTSENGLTQAEKDRLLARVRALEQRDRNAAGRIDH